MIADLLTQQALYNLLLTLFAAVAASTVGFIVKTAQDFAHAHLSQKHYEIAFAVARDVVLAVEQEATKYGWSSTVKYAQAAKRITAIVDAHGLNLSDEQVQSLLEATVRSATGAAHKVAPVEGVAP